MTDVFLQLDSVGEATYRPGERLKLTVDVHADEPTKCKSLHVVLRYVAHGRGNTKREEVARVELLVDTEIPAGERSFPAELELPYGPYSYAGHYMNVSWEVEAHLDIPWALDKKDIAQFVLTPEGAAAPALESQEELWPRPESDKHSALATIIAGFGAMLVLLSLVVVIGAGWGSIPCAGFMAILGGAMVFFGGKRLLAERVIKEPRIHFEPWPVRLGETLHYTMSFTPGVDLELHGATLTLEVSETVRQGHGTDSSTYSHTLHEEEHTLHAPARCAKGERVELEVDLTCPAHLPPSYEIQDNDLDWEIHLRLDIPNWPDWTWRESIQVLPSLSTTPQEAPSEPEPETRGSAW